MRHTPSTQIRVAAGLQPRDTFPAIVVVPGYVEPEQRGESYYHTTPSGKTRVYHPSAYGWRTWYHPSTRHVAVGRDWLAFHWPAALAAEGLDGLRALRAARRLHAVA